METGEEVGETFEVDLEETVDALVADEEDIQEMLMGEATTKTEVFKTEVITAVEMQDTKMFEGVGGHTDTATTSDLMNTFPVTGLVLQNIAVTAIESLVNENTEIK